jgi:hypothetical protein
MSCIIDSAAIYIMVVKFRNTTWPPPLQLSLHRRAALSSYSNGTRSYISERTQNAVYIVRCLWAHVYKEDDILALDLRSLWLYPLGARSNSAYSFPLFRFQCVTAPSFQPMRMPFCWAMQTLACPPMGKMPGASIGIPATDLKVRRRQQFSEVGGCGGTVDIALASKSRLPTQQSRDRIRSGNPRSLLNRGPEQ